MGNDWQRPGSRMVRCFFFVKLFLKEKIPTALGRTEPLAACQDLTMRLSNGSSSAPPCYYLPKILHFGTPPILLFRCGASWAFSTASVAADRLAIQSAGTELLSLSTQNLLACNDRGQQGCNGGHLDRAWNYMRRFG